jgi:hypothetical protein
MTYTTTLCDEYRPSILIQFVRCLTSKKSEPSTALMFSTGVFYVVTPSIGVTDSSFEGNSPLTFRSQNRSLLNCHQATRVSNIYRYNGYPNFRGSPQSFLRNVVILPQFMSQLVLLHFSCNLLLTLNLLAPTRVGARINP